MILVATGTFRHAVVEPQIQDWTTTYAGVLFYEKYIFHHGQPTLSTYGI